MTGAPSPESVRETLRALPDLDRKVVGGLLFLMIAEPERIRDQEWLSERFVRVAVVAHGFDAEAADPMRETLSSTQRNRAAIGVPYEVYRAAQRIQHRRQQVDLVVERKGPPRVPARTLAMAEQIGCGHAIVVP